MVKTLGSQVKSEVETEPVRAQGNLYEVPEGSRVRVIAIYGGWGARRNLNQIGVHVGDVLRVIRRAPVGGPVLVKSHGAEVAIGKRLAGKVTVERVG